MVAWCNVSLLVAGGCLRFALEAPPASPLLTSLCHLPEGGGWGMGWGGHPDSISGLYQSLPAFHICLLSLSMSLALPS